MDAHGHDWRDNPERFAALSSVAAMIGADGIEGWRPQILHCHDWQAGFVPLYLRELGAAGRVSTLMTIHNIAFQGMAPASRIGTLGLPRTGFHQRGYEFWDSVSALKAGLVYADKLSTVSPTYAAELMTKDFGMGLEGVLRERQEDMVGILNGIDEALDAQTRAAMQDLAVELLRGRTVLAVTHDPGEAARLGHAILVLTAAGVTACPPPDAPVPRPIDDLDTLRCQAALLRNLRDAA